MLDYKINKPNVCLKWIAGVKVSPARRAPLRGERSWRRAAPSERFNHSTVVSCNKMSSFIQRNRCKRYIPYPGLMFCKMLKIFGLIPNILVVKNIFVVIHETMGDDFDNKLPTNKMSPHDTKVGLITFIHFLLHLHYPKYIRTQTTY